MSEEKEKEKENVLARGVASAIKPTQILVGGYRQAEDEVCSEESYVWRGSE